MKMKDSYKYHEYIDSWIRMVENEEVESCEEQKQLIELIKKVLDSDDVVIDSEKIYKGIETVEKFFPFKLLPFQRFFFCFIDGVYYKDGSLVFDEFFNCMGRGAGKNGFISFVAFYLQSNLHGVQNYDIDIVAMSEEQAKTSFEEVYSVIETHESLQTSFNRTKEEITFNKTNSTLKYRTSNAKTKDGGRPGAVIFDECHQYENYDNVGVFIGGLGKVAKPRTFYITTDGFVRESVLDDLKERSKRILTGEDDHNGFFPFIFKMDNIDEIENPDLWEKAIPRINDDVTLKRTVTKQFQQMKYNSELKETFLTKRMNLPYQSVDKVVAEWEDILATDQPIPNLEGAECIGSIDYAELKDFCSVGLLFKEDGKRIFKQHTFIHEKSLQATNYNIDITEAIDLGLATIVRDVPIIPPKILSDWFKVQAETYNVKKVVCDSFRYLAIREVFEEEGIPIETIRSGYITHNKLHPLVSQIFADRTLIFGDDKLQRWYTNNVFVKTDTKGNKSYHKIEPFRRKTDGFFAFLHALSCDEELSDSNEFIDIGVMTF